MYANSKIRELKYCCVYIFIKSLYFERAKIQNKYSIYL